ncbi:GFA family protein [Paraglaciecola hydrolytica]|uniref:Aldehyde-activating protein n=1 Tax=Paraglaciecola hydrolytica TaxID=1799789 RepID=A0A148KMX0_9ALTE|nr:GFA family protein [Paraglaciecola hydrolytica]KXI27588.1 aldehyde-activating protein [Paraglaciecola hydrolytica]
MIQSTASCLCSRVKITANNINPQFSVCHCETCRTWAGGPFFGLQCGTDVVIEGSDKVKEYDSSSWATRGFCSECGTHLFYKFKTTGEYNMPVGLFKNLPDLTMDMQYFSDQRPDYYCFTNQSKHLSQAEIMAYFASIT